MRPFPRRDGLTLKQRVFNYRLSRARRVIENTFGILVVKWRILKRPINTSVKTAENIVKAAVCLHNYCKMTEATTTENRKYHSRNITDTGDGENGS